jgi:hypothetical protein
VTADELHQLGLDELERIHAELDERFAELGYPTGAPLSDQIGRLVAASGTVPMARWSPNTPGSSTTPNRGWPRRSTSCRPPA